jgi:hypothetical protein
MNNTAAVFMLKSVFLYSENPKSQESARRILLDYSVRGGPDCPEMVKARDGYYGGFMHAVCDGDFFDAYQLADSTNQEALAIGMGRFLQPKDAEQTNLYDDGLEPSDYLPQTEEVKQ